MEGSSLSDAKVIEKLNTKFIPLYADVDETGFPVGMPAIEKYRNVWKFMDKHKWGIATSAITDPTGRVLLGESGAGFYFQWKTSTNYYPDRFMSFLEKALAKSAAPPARPDESKYYAAYPPVAPARN